MENSYNFVSQYRLFYSTCKMATSNSITECYCPSAQSEFFSVIVNVESIRTMVLIKRTMLIQDLIKEIERTYHRLCNTKISIHIVKNSVNAILPSWYPVQPLLKEGDQIFALTGLPFGITKYHSPAYDVRNEDSGFSTQSYAHQSHVQNVAPFVSPGGASACLHDQQNHTDNSSNCSESSGFKEHHARQVSPKGQMTTQESKSGEYSGNKRHLKEDSVSQPRRKKLRTLKDGKKRNDNKKQYCKINVVESTDQAEEMSSSPRELPHNAESPDKINETLLTMNEQEEEDQNANKSNCAETSSSSDSKSVREIENNDKNEHVENLNEVNNDSVQVDDKNVEGDIEDSEDRSDHQSPEMLTNKTIVEAKDQDIVNEDEKSKGKENVIHTPSSTCSDETYQKVKEMSKVQPATALIRSIQFSDKSSSEEEEEEESNSDSASSWSSSVDNQKETMVGKKDAKNTGKVQDSTTKNGNKTQAKTNNMKQSSSAEKHETLKNTQSRQNNVAECDKKTPSSQVSIMSEEIPFTPLPHSGSNTSKRQDEAKTPKKSGKTRPLRSSEKEKVERSANKVTTWLLKNDVTGVEVDTDVEQSPAKTRSQSAKNKRQNSVSVQAEQLKTMKSDAKQQSSENAKNTPEQTNNLTEVIKDDSSHKQPMETMSEVSTNRNRNKKKSKRRKFGQKETENNGQKAKQNAEEDTVEATSQLSQSSANLKGKATALTLPKNSKGLSALFSDADSIKPARNSSQTKLKMQPWWLETSSSTPSGFLDTTKNAERKETRSGPGKQRTKKMTSSKKSTTPQLNNREQELLSRGGLNLETLLNDENIKW